MPGYVDLPFWRFVIFWDAETSLIYNELRVSGMPHLLYAVTINARQAKLLPDI